MVSFMIRKYICSIVILGIASGWSYAQLPTVLTLAPDARSTGMADMGVATSPDINSQYFNVAKYAFVDKAGIALSYSPWMRKLSPDMNTLYLAGHIRLGDNNCLSGSVSFFSLGEIVLSDGMMAETRSPSEWAIDVGYARRLTPNISLGMTFRYVSAVYADWNVFTIFSAGAIAADAGVYFQYPAGKNRLSAGLSITNVGTQLNFGGDTRASLPMALRIGVNYLVNPNDDHTLSLGVEINQPFAYGKGNSFEQALIGIGTEYTLQKMFLFRAGYLYNNKHFGDRSRLSFGAGVLYLNLGFDISYWLPLSSSNNALDNTVHLTVSCRF
jgi:hypothetical protein